MTTPKEQPAASVLGRDEAVRLLSAWSAWFLERHDVRYLLVKGIGLEHHGLRAPRASSDLDILVEPASFDRALRLLLSAGWERRPTTFAQDNFSTHSISLLHGSWPIDIDLHRFFPGFLEDPSRVFAALWDRRTQIHLAERSCVIPDRASSVLILALHSLRGLAAEPRHASELEGLRSRLQLTDAEREDLTRLAIETGSDKSLGDALRAVGVVFAAPDPEHDDDIRAWWTRVQSPSRSIYMWSSLWGAADRRSKLRVVRHALWPTSPELAVMYPDRERNFITRMSLRISRLGRGGSLVFRILLRRMNINH